VGDDIEETQTKALQGRKENSPSQTNGGYTQSPSHHRSTIKALSRLNNGESQHLNFWTGQNPLAHEGTATTNDHFARRFPSTSTPHRPVGTGLNVLQPVQLLL
jgi:hypothetical protein